MVEGNEMLVTLGHKVSSLGVKQSMELGKYELDYFHFYIELGMVKVIILW